MSKMSSEEMLKHLRNLLSEPNASESDLMLFIQSPQFNEILISGELPFINGEFVQLENVNKNLSSEKTESTSGQCGHEQIQQKEEIVDKGQLKIKKIHLLSSCSSSNSDISVIKKKPKLGQSSSTSFISQKKSISNSSSGSDVRWITKKNQTSSSKHSSIYKKKIRILPLSSSGSSSSYFEKAPTNNPKSLKKVTNRSNSKHSQSKDDQGHHHHKSDKKKTTGTKPLPKVKDKEIKPFSYYRQDNSLIKKGKLWGPFTDTEFQRNQRKYGLRSLSVPCLDLLKLSAFFHKPGSIPKYTTSVPLRKKRRLLVSDLKEKSIEKMEKLKITSFKLSLNRMIAKSKSLAKVRKNPSKAKHHVLAHLNTSKKDPQSGTKYSTKQKSKAITITIKDEDEDKSYVTHFSTALKKVKTLPNTSSHSKAKKSSHKSPPVNPSKQPNKHQSIILLNNPSHNRPTNTATGFKPRPMLTNTKRAKSPLLLKQKKIKKPFIIQESCRSRGWKPIFNPRVGQRVDQIKRHIEALAFQETKKSPIELITPPLKPTNNKGQENLDSEIVWLEERKPLSGNVYNSVRRLLSKDTVIEFPIMPSGWDSESYGDYVVLKISWWQLKNVSDPADSVLVHPELHDETESIEEEMENLFGINQKDAWQVDKYNNDSDDSSMIGASDDESLAIELSNKVKYDDPDRIDEFCGANGVGNSIKIRRPGTPFEKNDFLKIFKSKPGTNYEKNSLDVKCFICDEVISGQRQLGAHIRGTRHKNSFRNMSLKIAKYKESREKFVPVNPYKAQLKVYKLEELEHIECVMPDHVSDSDDSGGDNKALKPDDDLSIPGYENYNIKDDHALNDMKLKLRMEGKWTNELEVKWLKLKEEESRIKAQYENDREEYIGNPQSHPYHGQEWLAFWKTRSQELVNEGKDPEKHDFNREWLTFWLTRIQEIMMDEVIFKIDNMKKCIGMDLDALKKSDAQQGPKNNYQHRLPGAQRGNNRNNRNFQRNRNHYIRPSNNSQQFRENRFPSQRVEYLLDNITLRPPPVIVQPRANYQHPRGHRRNSSNSRFSSPNPQPRPPHSPNIDYTNDYYF